ncbi:hypothetical protein D6D01_08505 [Aureobasidium pullulans]|uniref:Uncharacterized protein n=1 Tax=Aureobasidium pullulans TaxID=5580 RepID=A0A4S9KC02_AURPU|nr:hypothetical protein D6D01_08505 [Aureobasidium pullulans]
MAASSSFDIWSVWIYECFSRLLEVAIAIIFIFCILYLFGNSTPLRPYGPTSNVHGAKIIGIGTPTAHTMDLAPVVAKMSSYWIHPPLSSRGAPGSDQRPTYLSFTTLLGSLQRSYQPQGHSAMHILGCTFTLMFFAICLLDNCTPYLHQTHGVRRWLLVPPPSPRTLRIIFRLFTETHPALSEAADCQKSKDNIGANLNIIVAVP